MAHSRVSASTFESQLIGQGPQTTDVRVIKPGQVIEGRLNGGESHTYTVALKAREYMKIAAGNHNVDFTIRVFDPTGKATAEIALGGRGPTESLWMLAETTGDYQIKIAGPGPHDPYLQYAINLETVAELNTAPSSDQEYVKAHRVFWEGSELCDQGRDQPLHQAAEKYQEALSDGSCLLQ